MALRAIFLRGIFKHFQKKSNFSGSWSHEYLPKKSGSKKSGCVKTSNRNSHQACWGASSYSIRNHCFKISKKTLCSKKMLWLGRTCHGKYPNFHSNTRLSQTHWYFDLTGTSNIVHSLDTAKWNLHRHTMDVLHPTGLCVWTRIAVDLLTDKAVWSGGQVHVCSGGGGEHCKLKPP